MTKGYEERTYRRWVRGGRLASQQVTVQETDLSVYADDIGPELIKEAVIEQRGQIEHYIEHHPGFRTTLEPWPDDVTAPPIVREMIRAGRRAGVGPMAAVAGAVAERVGRALLNHTGQVIVENGGDIFLSVESETVIGLYAGASPLSHRLGLKIDPGSTPLSVCTSSGTVGHSKSFGKADAVCVLSPSCALADAAATAIANHVQGPEDIEAATRRGQSIPGVLGVLVVTGEKMGMWGQIEITAIAGSRDGGR
jgi:ApbE superfamily uncharacterized protein (UPF0280 family)